MSTEKLLYGTVTNDEIYTQSNFILEENFDDALEAVNELIIKYSTHEECYFLRGDLFSFNHKYIEAIYDYDRGIEINNSNAIYFHTRGSTLINNSEFLEAIDDFQTIIDNKDLIHRDYVLSSAYAFRAISYCCIGEWEKCHKDIAYVKEDFITYHFPIKNKINKKRLEECVSRRILLV